MYDFEYFNLQVISRSCNCCLFAFLAFNWKQPSKKKIIINDLSFFLSQHYLDLDLSKYESSRYMNVEEIVDSANFQKPTPDNGEITDEEDALKDTNVAIEQVITRL